MKGENLMEVRSRKRLRLILLVATLILTGSKAKTTSKTIVSVTVTPMPIVVRVDPVGVPEDGWPLRKISITTHFHTLRKTKGKTYYHDGIDLDGKRGDPVYPVSTGVVEKKDWIEKNRNSGWGNNILVDYGNVPKLGAKVWMRFSHLARVFVKPGEKVNKFNQIGTVGNSGRTIKGTDGTHLDWRCYVGSKESVHIENPRVCALALVARDRGE